MLRETLVISSLGLLLVVLSLPLPVQGASPSPTEADVAYGPDPLQTLDIYRPHESRTLRPAVIWIHGGGWHEGDKRIGPSGISVLGPLLVSRGFVAFSCNYRLAPAHFHPAQVDDVQRVVRWVRANARKYGVDPDRIGAVGISAGAHLAAMLGVRDTRAEQQDGLDRYSSRVQAVVALNGVYDLRSEEDLLFPPSFNAARKMMGKDPKEAASLWADASPIAFVTPKQTQRMFAALKAAGADAQLLTIPGAGHPIFPSITPAAREALLDFFVAKLRP